MSFIRTTATNKLLTLTKRIRGVAGGTSASKTISILLILIHYCQTRKGKVVSVVSETMPHLRKGAMRDFKNIMESHNYWDESKWNETNSTYNFDGTILEFFSADDAGKVRGPRRDVLFINEANNVPFETYEQLEVRTSETIWLDWNPVTEFWFYTEVKDNDHVDFIILTYKDNEALNPAIVASIESRREKKNWWKVYGEGQLGEAEGRIYTGWIQIDTIPHEAKLIRRGLDFGYSNDPTALIDVYQYNGARIYDELIYRKGMSNKDIADVINNQEEDVLTKADSAEPKSIDEIRSYGVNILPARKGKDSVVNGIQRVQDKKVYVTKRSINLWKEYQNYLWETDKDGKILNIPQDIWNHCMDGIRYAEEEEYLVSDELEWEAHQHELEQMMQQRGY